MDYSLVNFTLGLQQLTQTVDDLTEEVNSLREKLSAKDKLKINGSPKACHSPKSEKKSKNRLSKSDPAQEVKTLRKVKQELEEQLSDSKSTTLSFHASFQAEFDLRTQIEQRLDELRERYEVIHLKLAVFSHNQTATPLVNCMVYNRLLTVSFNALSDSIHYC